MKLSKVKTIIKQDDYCRIVQTEPRNNMLRQWVCGRRAAYPVREAKISYDTLLVAWEMKPEEWDAMVTRAIEEEEGGRFTLQDVMENIPETIDTDTQEGVARCVVNGWVIVSRGQHVYAIEPGVIAPCKTKNRMHLLPVLEGDIRDGMGMPYYVPDGLIAVYDDGKLEGLVMAAVVEKCAELVDKCRAVGGMIAGGA